MDALLGFFGVLVGVLIGGIINLVVANRNLNASRLSKRQEYLSDLMDELLKSTAEFLELMGDKALASEVSTPEIEKEKWLLA